MNNKTIVNNKKHIECLIRMIIETYTAAIMSRNENLTFVSRRVCRINTRMDTKIRVSLQNLSQKIESFHEAVSPSV